jgi:hypothetical protein
MTLMCTGSTLFVLRMAGMRAIRMLYAGRRGRLRTSSLLRMHFVLPRVRIMLGFMGFVMVLVLHGNLPYKKAGGANSPLSVKA